MGTADDDGVFEVYRDRVDRPLSRLFREYGLAEIESLPDEFLADARRRAAQRPPRDRED